MKTLFVTLVAFAVLFVIGCQENSVTDPLTTDSANKTDITSPYQHGFIKLDGMLKDPRPIMNSYFIINGQVEFEHRLVFADPEVVTAKRYASLNLITSADFRYYCTLTPPSPEDELAGFIEDVSEEYVPIGGNYLSLLEKTYAIQGREDGMVLKCRFLVSNSGIELSAMWLAFLHQSETATVNQ